jgi:hypothetical protein
MGRPHLKDCGRPRGDGGSLVGREQPSMALQHARDPALGFGPFLPGDGWAATRLTPSRPLNVCDVASSRAL